MGFYKNINDIIVMMEDYFKKLGFQKVSTDVVINERETNFPHLIIIPKREIIENTIIGDNVSNCEFTVQLLIEVRKFKKELGVSNLLKLTGDVIDTIYKIRDNESHKLFDDLIIETIDNNFSQGPNYILYSSMITIRISFIFEH
jgi:hypothetical protein